METREILNKILWHPSFTSKKGQFIIQYTHRGAKGDNLTISCELIDKVNSDSFEYRNESIREPVRIPFHRIEKIFNNQTHEILYKKRVSGDPPSG